VSTQHVSLLTLDPDLGQLLPADRRRSAERDVLVRVHGLPVGEWPTARLGEADPAHLGLLVIEGMLAREVVVADTVSAELVGTGDLVRPWQLADEHRLLQADVRWMVLTPTRLAVLDARAASTLARYPEITTVFIDRLNERARRLATTQAISQLNRVDRRLMALLWHLAERWGRVVPGGIAVPLALSHRLLAQLVGARRPTVSTALGELRRNGALTRRDDGTWVITGDPVGLPTGEAARAVRGRRVLLPAAPAEAPPEPPPVVASPMPQMQAALERLRDAHERGNGELAALATRAAELRDQSMRLRAQLRDRARR